MIILGAMVTIATAARTGEEGAATVAEMAATASTTGAPAPEGATSFFRPHYSQTI